VENTTNPPAWWELHLRKARGERLSEQEQQLYDAEMARHDRESAPLRTDLAALKQMRKQVLTLARMNSQLRARVEELDQEMHRIEHLLSRETREALGIGE
jgi:hypothetical protein